MENTTRQFKIENNRGSLINICEGQSIYNPSAILIQIHGIGGHFQFIFDSEDMFEYKNFVFSKKNIKSYGLELSGHGNSDGLKCSIDNYEDLVEDIRTCVIYLRSKHPNLKIFIYGESMGAGLSIIYQTKYKSESLVSGYLFVAPLCGFVDKLKPNRILINVINIISYLIPTFKFLNIKKELSNACKNKEYLNAKLKSKHQYNQSVRLNTIREIYKVCCYLENNYSEFDSPFYVFHSINDEITCSKKTVEFFKNASSINKKIYLTKNSNHIITLPIDKFDKRPNIILEKMLKFIEQIIKLSD